MRWDGMGWEGSPAPPQKAKSADPAIDMAVEPLRNMDELRARAIEASSA
jgi:hypothetical protein